MSVIIRNFKYDFFIIVKLKHDFGVQLNIIIA